ncbi:uncharacterized protein Z518_03602 [Rhinocladiella mackenziei CBS 650.93]|uniref:3-oxoacyl-[acyl-carrier-protein] reductase n=1 Tax=Rhinocladiella mackenziei CBS 650.93 TaxID=1442369 RepID=A0A0D2J935_9EURO|nr:uncharacterized protein Z518_03602 [Rhinocladiella mackenziei CBS 650.93]KIX05630.1 hypothetical protein Z518_03602 [Rhinocladiella mackenziei CBS 650.93]
MTTTDELRFDGRVAIVTGAGRGMGYHHAHLLAQRGASVVLVDLNEKTATEAEAKMTAQGLKVKACVGDVRKPESIENIVKTAIDSFGRIDILVNNAGTGGWKAFTDWTREEIYDQMEVHCIGPCLLSQACWPYMAKQKYGRIVVVLSSSMFGMYGHIPYTAAKAGALGLAINMAYEGQQHGIKVNGLDQAAGTELLKEAMGNGPVKDWILENLRPEDPAATCAYLCHESCPVSGDYITAAGKGFSRYFFGGIVGHSSDVPLTPELVRDSFYKLSDLSDYIVMKSGSQASDFIAKRHGLDSLAGLDVIPESKK